MTQKTPATSANKDKSLVFYSHSQIFYFWPVWLTALILGALSYFMEGGGEDHAAYAPLLVFVLLYVIIATGVSMRGLWFVLVSLALVILGLVAHMTGVVDDLLHFLTGLDLRFSTDVYWAIGVPLLVVWLLATFIYDRLRYVEVYQGRMVLVREVGEGQHGYDTIGMAFEKRRDNFAQHIILGFGSGDLIITPREGDPMRIPNVLCVSRKITEMQKLINHGDIS